MSKLTRVLALAAMLAAMTLAGLTAVAQAQPTGNDAVELFRRGERASLEQPTSDSVTRAAEAQERYYSTWSYGDTPAPAPAPAPAEPGGQPDWLVPALGVLAAALALSTGLAVLAARRANRRVRAGQAA